MPIKVFSPRILILNDHFSPIRCSSQSPFNRILAANVLSRKVTVTGTSPWTVAW